jgi:hypothetical protein
MQLAGHFHLDAASRAAGTAAAISQSNSSSQVTVKSSSSSISGSSGSYHLTNSTCITLVCMSAHMLAHMLLTKSDIS